MYQAAADHPVGLSDFPYQMVLQLTSPGGSVARNTYERVHANVCLSACVGNICVFISKGPQQLVCLHHDGWGPSGFPSVLPIPSHQPEMLIVPTIGKSKAVLLARSS